MDYLKLGTVIDSFSLDGTLKILSSSNLKDVRYKKGNKIFLCNEKENAMEECEVESFRTTGQFDFLKVKEINVKEEAISKKGFTIKVVKDRNVLSKNSYFYSDLEGCIIIDESNNELGKVSVVEEFPAQVTLRVNKKDGKSFFVPFIKEFILNVDIEKKIIKIKVIEGLL